MKKIGINIYGCQSYRGNCHLFTEISKLRTILHTPVFQNCLSGFQIESPTKRNYHQYNKKKYCKVTSRRLFWLVAHPSIFRMVMFMYCDLWPKGFKFE